MYSSAKMGDAMKTTAQTMSAFNKQMNPAQVAKTMQDFEKANMQMGMTDEISMSITLFLTQRAIYVSLRLNLHLRKKIRGFVLKLS